jgi:3-hydroxymyristoyl/3-hydroxydecanoyl-(acyl carrier protein) dehydratase
MNNNGVVRFAKQKITEMLFQKQEFNLPDYVSIKLDQPDATKIGQAWKDISLYDFYINRHGGYYPGTMLVEVIAQTAQIVTLHFYPELAKEKIGFFNFGNPMCRNEVKPGDALNIEVEITRRRSRFVQFSGKITNHLFLPIMELKGAMSTIITKS